MKIDRYSSLPHYAEHIDPIWQALPEEVRGQSWAPRSGCWWGKPDYMQPGPHPGPVLVAGCADAKKMHPRPLVYVEHGAGQAYPADPRSVASGSYAGGAGLDRVVLFVAPSETVADRWRAEYRAPVAVVGCPKLDRWHNSEISQISHGTPPPARHRSPSDDGPKTVVAVTFHWDCQLIPETRSAFTHYRGHLAGLVEAVRAGGGEVWGHGHPRAWGRLQRTWRTLGVPLVPYLADVIDGADVLVADNTSAAYEFASLDRPVVTLNAPWYRREVEHGLRFWSHVPGDQVNEPGELVPIVLRAMTGPEAPHVTALRARAVDHVYAHRDGHAAERAAAAIMEVLTDG